MREDAGEIGPYSCNIDISVCCKYIVVAAFHRFVLQSVEHGETIRSLTLQPVMNYITKVMFSVDHRAVFVCGRVENSSVIKLWRPYLDDTDEDGLITLWEQKNRQLSHKIIVSHDRTMITIQDIYRNKGWLLSIDNHYNCMVQQLNFQGGVASLQLLDFTPNDECIIYATTVGLKYWSVAGSEFIDKEYVLYNERHINSLLTAVNCSPNNRQVISFKELTLQDDINAEDSPLYMKSIFCREKIK